MRKSLLTLAVTSAFAMPSVAFAQTAPAPAAAPSSPHTVAGNAALVTDYRFRGISQTYLGPAFQGGIDYSHSSGIYIGNWNSNVSSTVYSGGSALEMDFYGGYKKSFGDFGMDIGYIYYYYPNAEWNARTGSTRGAKKFDNQELYLAGSWKWLSLKYSYVLSDYFGTNTDTAAGGYWVNKTTGLALDPTASKGGSKGSSYLDFTATYPVTDKFSLIGHVGKTKVKKYGELDYTDYKLGVTYDLSGWVLGAAFIDTNAKNDWYYTAGSKGNKDTGKGTMVFSVAKTF